VAGPVGLAALLSTASFLGVAISPLPGSDMAICGALPPGSTLPDGGTLSSQQSANAAIVVAVAEQAGAGTTGAVDAVDAAFTESRLINVPGGDRDSLGLFQQRPSEGWGTPSQILDPIYAATQFVDHLMRLPGWQSLAPAAAAQAVERSAFPERYQEWVQPASQLVAGLSGTGACTNADAATSAAVELPGGYRLPDGTAPPAGTAIGFALGQLGKPYIWGGVGPSGFDCSGLVMEAYRAAGIPLPRSTYDQVYAGQPVYDLAALAPGDLLFTEGADPGPGGLPGHVGMYIGAGTVVDAPHTGATVELTRLSAWTAQIVAVRRMVPA
jgi:cell wall-associated NlpC family hydrolase